LSSIHLKSKLRHYNPFWNAKTLNEGEWANFAFGKGPISNLRSKTYCTMKIWWKLVRWILK